MKNIDNKCNLWNSKLICKD